jgi:hypothetical protein
MQAWAETLSTAPVPASARRKCGSVDRHDDTGRSSSEGATMSTPTLRWTLPLSDRSGHVGDQDVSAQIVQPSDALGATDPLAQRTLPRSASKHPDCRSRAGAGVDHADHIVAELERHQPPLGRGGDCWFVA